MLTLIEFIIAIGQRLIGLSPGPGGSTLDPAFAETIATDWAKLQPAQVYWNARFAALNGGNPSLSPAPEWLALTLEASNVNPATLVAQRDVIRTRPQYDAIVTTRENEGPILRDLDALLSGAEIASFIGFSSSPPVADLSQSLLVASQYRALNTTAAAAVGSDDMRVVGRGLRAARELLDAGQRFQFARTNTALFDTLVSIEVKFPELLALHRAEGAFCMQPAMASLPHAPLIRTARTLGSPPLPPGPPAARTESAFVNLSGIAFCRPGYAPTFGVPAANARERELLVLLGNGLTLGGLDNLVSWPVQFDNVHNELALLVDKAIADDVAGIGALMRGWEPSLMPTTRPALLFAVQGIAMAHYEANSMLTGDGLIAAVVADLVVMRSFSSTSTASDFSIFDDDARSNTGKFLELTGRWYASRTRPETLLARSDRAPFLAMERLSPYMSYLRFHSGDVIFMGLLLRVAKELGALRTQWTAAMGRATFAGAINATPHSDFGAALDASSFSIMTPAEKGAISSALTKWRQSTTKYVKGRGESVWRHVGLLSTIIAPWKPDPPAAGNVDTQHVRALADAVLGAMTAIQDNALMGPITRALEFMPLDRLFGRPSFNEKNWAANLRKAENFERLRMFIDAARTHASLDDMGDPIP